MTEKDSDPFFRQLELVAGAEAPLTWSARALILVYVDRGNMSFASSLVQQHHDKAAPYLAELLGLPDDAPPEQIYDELRKARADKLGLSNAATFDQVMEQELDSPRSMLTMSDLRRLRDMRSNAHQPLANDGKW